MGTRADFFVGIGPQAEWLGSIAWDGYPNGNPEPIFAAQSLDDFRRIVAAILVDHGTQPAGKWPWPWHDHRTTDYAYAWAPDAHSNERVVISGFGRPWRTQAELEAHEERCEVLYQKLGSFDNDEYRALDVKLRDDEVRDMREIAMTSNEKLAASGLLILKGG